MKKLFLLLLINISFNAQNLVTAQSRSITETKKILCSHKWVIQGMEEDGKNFPMPEQYKGAYWIFKLNGSMISFSPAAEKPEVEEATWSITEKQLTIVDVEYKTEQLYEYRLEGFADIKLRVSSTDVADDNYTLIFKQAEKIENTTTKNQQDRFELAAKKIEVTTGNYILKEGDDTFLYEITLNANGLLLKSKGQIAGPIKYTESFTTVRDILNKYYYNGNVSNVYLEVISSSKIIFYGLSKPYELIKTEDKAPDNAFSNYFDDLDVDMMLTPYYNKPQWRFLYTKGETMGTQRRQKTKSFPEKEIQKDWLDGRYVTDISFGGPDNDKNWVLINSKNKFTDQFWRTADNSTDLEKTIVDVKNKNPDFYISHITYGDGKWVLVFSKGTGYSGQTTIISSTFPEADIATYGGKGFSITDLAYGGGKWTVCMSKNPANLGQHYSTPNSWDQNKIKEYAATGYYVTETVKQGDKWWLVFSKDKNISSQQIDFSEKIPAEEIQKRWKEGYDVSRTYYY
jgi:hypothetical protein